MSDVRPLLKDGMQRPLVTRSGFTFLKSTHPLDPGFDKESQEL